MTTDKYINDNKTETFKKGDKVIMHSCHEATFEEYKDKVWICATSSFLDKGKQDVVFLEDFSGYFLSKYLKICNSTGMSFVLLNQRSGLINVIDMGESYTKMKL